MKKLFIFLNILFFGLVFFAGTVRAADQIDVEYPVGTNINGNNIFHADNIAPGWEDSKTIRIRNESVTDDTNLYLTFNLKDGKKLAEKLKLFVVREADNSYRIGGTGDRWTLGKADDEKLFTDKLSKGESEKYKIKIRFDESAGNEYQGLESKVDIDFTIESENAGAGTAAQILASEGRSGFTGAEPAVLGEQSVPPTEEVAGEENCKPVSWIMFALLLLAYAILLNYNLWHRFKQQLRPRWQWEAVLMVAALVAWFYLDRCNTNRWFIYAVIIAGFISYLTYLQFLRKFLNMKNQ